MFQKFVSKQVRTKLLIKVLDMQEIFGLKGDRASLVAFLLSLQWLVILKRIENDAVFVSILKTFQAFNSNKCFGSCPFLEIFVVSFLGLFVPFHSSLV